MPVFELDANIPLNRNRIHRQQITRIYPEDIRDDKNASTQNTESVNNIKNSVSYLKIDLTIKFLGETNSIHVRSCRYEIDSKSVRKTAKFVLYICVTLLDAPQNSR